MITKLSEWKLIKENRLVPKNLEGRAEKLRQIKLQLLQQEIIDGDVEIDHTYKDFTWSDSKIREINGNLTVYYNYERPEFIKNIKVNGTCVFQALSYGCSDLENSPYHVSYNFYVSDSHLKSLDGCPKFIGYDFKIEDFTIRGREWAKKFKEEDLPKDVDLKGTLKMIE